MNSRHCIALTLLMAAALAGCEPLFMSGREVEVHGAFHADGRCQFVTPRGTMPPAGGRALVAYHFGGLLNVATGDNTVHELSCGGVGDAVDAGGVSILLSVPPGVPLSPGRYRVVPGRIPSGGAHVFLIHPAYAIGTRGAGLDLIGVGHISLEAVSGEVEIRDVAHPDGPELAGRDPGYIEVPNPRVEARFRVRARRVWSLE